MRTMLQRGVQRTLLLGRVLPALLYTTMLGGVAQARTPDAVITDLHQQVRLEGVDSREAHKGDGLWRGHRVTTGEGASAGLTFSDGTQVQLGERSELVIVGEDAGPAHSKASDTTLRRGRLQVHIAAPAPGRRPGLVVIATPNAQVRMSPGDGVVEFSESRGTRVNVDRGEWGVRAHGQQVQVGRGFTTRVATGAGPTEPERAAPAASPPAPRAESLSGTPPAPELLAQVTPAAQPAPRVAEPPVVEPVRLTPAPAPIPPALDLRLADLQRQILELRAAQQATAQLATTNAPVPPGPGEPFAWGDFTWLNGGSRQTSKMLDTKYFTPQIDVDSNYTYSFNRPIDNTIVGSTATARHNELTLAFLGAGGDLHIGNVRGRLFLQYGTRSQAIPRNDLTPNRGQFNLQEVYRYLSEAYAGYHWNKLHGINLDVGLFFSYVGLFSYTQFENWGYQASFTSDNTPWFFNGARLQIFPTDRLKVELWLINGWQTYGKFNELPGIGYQIQYAPREWVKMVFNGYVGTDAQDHPGRVRFHSDNSLLIRYYNNPRSRGLSRAAFSATFDLGFEEGDGVTAFRGASKARDTDPDLNCTNEKPCEQDFVSGMAYNVLWFWQNQLSWYAGGGFMHNPGRYLVLGPTGVAATTFSLNPGTTFDGWDVSSNVSWHPTENLTFRLEGSHHESSVPYYAGHGGVTGPDGYKCGGLTDADNVIRTCAPTGWKPDLTKQETKLIFALLFRL